MSRVRQRLVARLFDAQRGVVLVAFKLFFFLKMRNQRYIPQSGPAILAPNHQTRFDGLPIGFKVPSPIYCAVERSYFHKPFIGWWLRVFGGIPLKFGRDRAGYQRCLEVLREGHRLIMFPEGSLTRDGKLRKIQPGAARAALTTGVDIVPVTIVGGFEVWARGKGFPKLFKPIVVKFYPPIRCEVVEKADLKPRIAEINAQLETIMNRRLAAWAKVKAQRAAV
ncbi:MAG: lysophospholipid acyltransferase family protein [Acidobacteriota bacterium]